MRDVIRQLIGTGQPPSAPSADDAARLGRLLSERLGLQVYPRSIVGAPGGILVPSYTASKSGVMGLTRLLACEWAPHGINVNAIAPGYMATRNTQAIQDDPVRSRQILERIPAGRWGHPDDLKGAVVFLASEASRYLQGHTLAVDGGWLAR